MKILHLIIAVFVLLLCRPLAPVMAQQGWNIMTEELPPYNFVQDNQVHGICTDVLLQLMGKNGISIDRKAIQMLPWARAYRMVQEIPGSILFSTGRTAEREDLFKWVGPITDLTIGLTALKERKIKLKSLADVEKYTIGTIRDGAPEQLVLKGGVQERNLDRIASPGANIKKLQAGRVDLFAFNVPSTRYLMIKMGLDPDNYENVYTLKQVDLYYAFHRDTDDRLIQAFNKTMQEMKQPDATGKSEVDRIIAGYLNP